MKRLLRFCVTSLLSVPVLCMLSVSLQAQGGGGKTVAVQQPTAVRAGAVSIVMPSPTNDLIEPGPDYRVVFEPLAPVANRLIAAFVMPDKMDAIHSGAMPQMDEYALVEVPRRAEFADIDSQNFKLITDAIGKQFGGDMGESQKTGLDDLNHNLKELGSSASVTIDKPVQLGTLFSKTDAEGFGVVTPYNVNGVTTRMATSIIALRVRNRILLAYLFAVYKDESTAKWLISTSEQWADAVLKANQ